jgi:hypothetical protein
MKATKHLLPLLELWETTMLSLVEDWRALFLKGSPTSILVESIISAGNKVAFAPFRCSQKEFEDVSLSGLKSSKVALNYWFGA